MKVYFYCAPKERENSITGSVLTWFFFGIALDLNYMYFQEEHTRFRKITGISELFVIFLKVIYEFNQRDCTDKKFISKIVRSTCCEVRIEFA